MGSTFRIITLIIGLVLFQNGYSQTLLEKLQQKKAELLKELSGENSEQKSDSTSGMPTDGQIKIAEKWVSGSYKTYKPDGFMMRPTGDKTNIRIVKDENGKLEGIGFGAESEASYYPVTRDGSTFVSAFVNNLSYLYFTDELVVCYSVAAIGGKVDYIRWVIKTKKRPDLLKAEIEAYKEYGAKRVLEDKQKIKDEEIAFRKENTLEGKEITKITPIYPDGKPTSIGFNESIEIGFEITLTNGTKVKTSNIGGKAYIEDLAQEEGMNGVISSLGKAYSSNFDGTNPRTSGRIRTKISDLNKDYMTITVKPKYKGNASCTIKLPIKYPMKISVLDNRGMSGYSNNNYESTGGNGSKGSNITAKIKTIKHSETGETLYLCEVGPSKNIYKLSLGGTLYISASGGWGGDGGPGRNASQYDGYKAPTDGGDGGNGGDGGTIKVYLDPSAKEIKLTYSVNGGNGGNGGIRGTCFSCAYGSDANFGRGGSAGSAGSFSKEIKTVKF